MANQKTFINPYSGKPIQHPEPASTGSGLTFYKEIFTTTVNQSVYSLSQTPMANSLFVMRNGQVLSEGINEDYTVSGTTLTLHADVATVISANEKILVQYCVEA